jgi:hypothetical protein
MQDEADRKAALAGIPNCPAYNLVKTTSLLPLAGQKAIATAYRRYFGCQHQENEDCMICANCGYCRESVDDNDICANCRGETPEDDARHIVQAIREFASYAGLVPNNAQFSDFGPHTRRAILHRAGELARKNSRGPK